MSDNDLLARAREEADAIVEEAQDQARRLLKAAEELRAKTGPERSELENVTEELAEQLEKTIARLNEILNQLRTI